MNSIANKEVNHSLNNLDNYKKELDADISEIAKKLSELLIDYLKFITNMMRLKKNNLLRFIIIRGLDTIINVFNYVLLYTKNLDVTYFHCQKAFYFYSEFVSQISDDEKMFLQLSSRDATTYVYKKTIYEIHSELKKNNEYVSDYTKLKLDTINLYVNIYKTFIMKLINNYVANNNPINLTSIENIFKKLYIINNTIFIQKLNDTLEILYYRIDNYKLFYEISNLIMKKTIKKPELFNDCNDKILSDEFYSKIEDTPEKFVLWLMN